MSAAIAIAELDLARGIGTVHAPPGTERLRLLVRVGSRLLGEIPIRPARDGTVAPHELASAVARRLGDRLMQEGAAAWLALPPHARAEWRDPGAALVEGLDALAAGATDVADGELPSVTVAVCTRDRPDDLAACLAAISDLDYPGYDVVVVDNAPATDATRRLVAERFPGMRYVREPRPGLDWARNRAILEATGEVVAFTDDDALVDRGWLRAYGRLFAASPELAAATGSVLPAELETEAQRLFEAYGGFLRGWRREWYRAPCVDDPDAPWHHAAGRFGTGANMAFRRRVFDEVGGFDPALDVGTPSDGGGDLEMYFRVLQEGFTLAYTPDALVRHRHRRELPALERQLRQWGTGFGAFVERSRRAYPGERRAFRRLTTWWWRSYAPRRAARALLGRSGVPLRCTLGEARGMREGPRAYATAVAAAARVAASFPHEPVLPLSPRSRSARGGAEAAAPAVAVRCIELAQPLAPLTDVGTAVGVEAVLLERGIAVGRCRVVAEGGVVSPAQLRERIGEALLESLDWTSRARARALTNEWLAARSAGAGSLPRVSIVVATADRPDDLRRCLPSLLAQDYAGEVEIVVVDNRPASGITSAVVADHPGVRLVGEPRAGLSYARNAGAHASRGDVIVMTDDDVVAPGDWLARLVTPFARPDVGLVTGNVLPLELETPSQRQFEAYGGLGRGFVRHEFDGHWFGRRGRPVPTWHIGATANAAVRRSVLADPAVGLLDEALGAGTPTGCSEDTYMFYRTLRAGWTIVYEPTAWLWHRHRRDAGALGRQLHAYSRGHVAYHLTTLLRDRDARALRRLLVELPLHDARSLWRWVRGRSALPLSLILREIGGHLAGPWALWRSQRRVRRLGRSQPLAAAPSAGHALPAGRRAPERTRAASAAGASGGPASVAGAGAAAGAAAAAAGPPLTTVRPEGANRD